jgi:hypothetical protein
MNPCVRRHSLFRMVVLFVVFWQWFAVADAQAAPAMSFVKRSGSDLQVDGRSLRFAGANIFWLALDSEGGKTIYPSDFRVQNAFATVSIMGGTVVRSQAALSTGCPMCIQPELGVFNENALRRLDFVLHTAREYGIRLVLPLTDNHQYFQGGKHHYTTWRGLGDENLFFTDATVIRDFKRHISTLLNRRNTYNGTLYKDEPAILAWETGNELSLWKGNKEYNGPPPPAWTADIATYIRAQGAKQLIMDGTNIRGKVTEDHGFPYTPYPVNIANVDIYSAHYYYHADWPKSIHMAGDLREDSTAVHAAGRAFIAGEYDWTAESNSLGEHKLPDFLATLEDTSTGIDGDLFWSLMGHDDNYGYAQHNDDYTLHYPGNTDDTRTRAQQLRTHAYRMTRLPKPPHPIPGTPTITSVSSVVKWRGVAGADSYTIERSVTGPGGPWVVVCPQCTNDWKAPYDDPATLAGAVLYRIKAHNMNGIAGLYSATPSVPSGPTTTDNLADWSKTSSRSANLKIDTANAARFGGDAARATRRTLTAEEIAWHLPGMTAFRATTYFWPSEPVAHFTVLTSADGVTWRTATPTITGGSGDWKQYTYALENLSNVNYVKMRWSAGGTQPWASQIAQVVLTGK